MAIKAPATEAPVLLVVWESFLGTDGTVYRKGEVIHPDDPHVKLMPGRFRPFEFPHPMVRRGATLTVPEVRS